jgi:hypothetical protein
MVVGEIEGRSRNGNNSNSVRTNSFVETLKRYSYYPRQNPKLAEYWKSNFWAGYEIYVP